MSDQTNIGKPNYGFLPEDLDGFNSLAEIALDLRWSWNHVADELWKQLDPSLWELTHNPWNVLQTVSRDHLSEMLADPSFKNKLDELLQNRKESAEASAWFHQKYPNSPVSCIAYFSMEFMLSEALPIYSGGLGNVAGDLLKAASDYGIPLIGIGLLYQQGYFRQVIDKDGSQQALYPYNDPGQLPITPLRKSNGEWLRLKIELPGYPVWIRTWQVQVGRVKLYLLDSNDPANIPVNQGITSELYGDGPELRLKQEIILGIGGWRLIKALGFNPEVCHLNEGHAAFTILERAYDFMKENGQSFETALTVTRAGNIFTTHTSVEAGFDRFSSTLIEHYFTNYALKKLGISIQDLLALGRIRPDDNDDPFNMAYLAVRGSGSVNGVSKLHGKISRHILSPLFPRWPEDEVPIGYITNGIHIPSWDSEASDRLWTEACNKERWLGFTMTHEEDIRKLPGEKIWRMKNVSRNALIEYARSRLSLQLEASGSTPEEADEARKLFNSNHLTLGFARRFATYKRPNLLLHDTWRLTKILTNSKYPVQLIIAGKAHPADKKGQAMIKEWIQYIRQPEIREHVMFLSDYDMLLTERLVQGIDVWINTPRRPWEACGTSGMKVLVNGGLNLSELDGWWAEAFNPQLGWALGDGLEHGDDPSFDAIEAETLYNLLENEIIPEFYRRDKDNIPVGWVNRIRESMAHLTYQYGATRMISEYTEQNYIPSAISYTKRSKQNGTEGKQIAEWNNTLNQKWELIHFGDLNVKTENVNHIFEIIVYADGVDRSSFKAEVYADCNDHMPAFKQEMEEAGKLMGTQAYVFKTSVPDSRPASDYTVRIIPYREDLSVPLENKKILWHH